MPAFKIYLNNRKLLGGYLEHLGIADKTTDVLRLVDKIKKIPEEAFLRSLDELGLPKEANQKLLSFIKIKGLNKEIIAKLEDLKVENSLFNEGLSELKTVIEQALNLGMPAENMQIDLSITRGLDYYTGTVYETFFDDYPQFGSVCSGGRYENLSSVFMDKKFPGVGISIGLTRLFDQLKDNNLLQIKAMTPNKALIITQDAAYQTNAVKLAGLLRQNGIAVDVMYRQCKFKKKMEYANKIGVPYLVIIGEEEAANNVYVVKDMTTGEQKTLNLDELIGLLKKNQPIENEDLGIW
ncbi:MAG: histidine--tRNA ligase family protein [Alphaproteobacteria bacterium]|nr:histidine--tRNA ligase family protein [Alphaproteobacteria bacterium]